jgi:hypothetical protein
VASPLVMAMHGSCVECNDVRLTHRGFCRSTHYLLLRRGGSATRLDKRRPHRPLRLRCAPPSATSGAIHARARESGHSMTSAERSEAREIDARIQRTCRVASPLVMAMRGSCVECNDVRLTHRGFCRSTHYLLLRRGVVPHGSTSDARIDRSGFAALRLRQHPVQSTRERAKAKRTSRPPRIHSEGGRPKRAKAGT